LHTTKHTPGKYQVKLMMGVRAVVYGGLREGTELQIVELKSDSNYEVGTKWPACAIVQNGEFHARRLLIPMRDSAVDWQYLARCDNPPRKAPQN
jgi:hypothetical protein